MGDCVGIRVGGGLALVGVGAAVGVGAGVGAGNVGETLGEKEGTAVG